MKGDFMKRFFNLIFVVLFLYPSLSFGFGEITRPQFDARVPVIDTSEYQTLAGAIAQATTSGKVLQVSKTITLTANVNLNVNVNLTSNGVFVVPTGKTLTFNKAFNATLSKHFDCTDATGKHMEDAGYDITTAGVVVFGGKSINEVYPAWWKTNTTPGTTNMTSGIDAAIQSTDGLILLAAENYLLTPNVSISGVLGGGSPVWGCFRVKDNMHIKGVQGKTILKIANGVSSNASPLFHGIFIAGSANNNVSFENITFDLNGQNNLINHTTCASAAIYWGGAAGKCDNLVIDNCTIKNSPGANPLAVAGVMADNVKITNNYFIDNGWDTTDHTTVLLFAKNSEISGNKFTIPSVTVIIQNAVDVHGPANSIRDNVIKDYASGIGVTQNEDLEDYRNTEVNNNIMNVGIFGIWVNRYGSGVHTHSNISVHDNIIDIRDETLSYTIPGAWWKPTAIVFTPDLDMSEAYITNNILSKIGGTDNVAYGIFISPNTGINLDAVFIEGNKIRNFTEGIAVLGHGAISDIHILNNTVTNTTPSTVPAENAYGINVGLESTHVIGSANITGNTVTGTTGTAMFITGIIDGFVYKNNTLYNNSLGLVKSGFVNGYGSYTDNNLSLLAIVTTNFHYLGEGDLFTVPSSQRCVLSHVVIVAGNEVLSTITIGADGSETDFLNTQTLTGLAAANDAVVLMPVPNATPVKLKSYAGGTAIKYVSGGSVSASATSTLYVYGYLY